MDDGGAAYCFHTTMVLTQPTYGTETETTGYMFPYHYGSHATKAMPIDNFIPEIVSIPLWFSRNERVDG